MLKYVDHPHIVRVIDMFHDNYNFYIVSELMKGGELYNYIIEKEKLSER